MWDDHENAYQYHVIDVFFRYDRGTGKITWKTALKDAVFFDANVPKIQFGKKTLDAAKVVMILARTHCPANIYFKNGEIWELRYKNLTDKKNAKYFAAQAAAKRRWKVDPNLERLEKANHHRK